MLITFPSLVILSAGSPGRVGLFRGRVGEVNLICSEGELANSKGKSERIYRKNRLSGLARFLLPPDSADTGVGGQVFMGSCRYFLIRFLSFAPGFLSFS